MNTKVTTRNTIHPNYCRGCRHSQVQAFYRGSREVHTLGLCLRPHGAGVWGHGCKHYIEVGFRLPSSTVTMIGATK